MSGARRDIVAEQPCHGYLGFGSLAEADADGVAYTFGKECAYAYGALYTAVFAVARLGNAEMKRIAHPLGVHCLDKQAHGAHHHLRVGGLYRNYNAVEILLSADTEELHHRLHHTLGRVAVAAHDAVGKGAVVHSEAECCAVGAAYVEQRKQGGAYTLDLGGILLVGKLQLAERAGGVDEVAGIDAHLLADGGRREGGLWIEMHVGHQRDIASGLVEATAHVGKGGRLGLPLGGEPHYLAAGFGYALRLPGAGFGVEGIGVGHRLQAHGVVASDSDLADAHLARRPAEIVVSAHFKTTVYAVST